MRVVKSSFNGGEFTRRLYTRYDLARYKNGCKTLTNMVALPHGPVRKRPGFEYIAEVKNSSKFTRLIPFQFSEEDSYILEFGDQYIRFYRNGGQIQTVASEDKLLLHLDGSRFSTTITDGGDTDHTANITANGEAKLETLIKKFGSACCYFNGVDSYLSVADHADWYMDSNDVTIDFWVNFSSLDTSNDYGLWDQYADANNYVSCYLNGTGSGHQLAFNLKDSGNLRVNMGSSAISFSTGTWYHFALIRGWGGSTNTFCLTVNGQSVATATYAGSWADFGAAFRIGRNEAIWVAGYIDEFRIVKGDARWTANFTPPTSQYPAGDDSGTTYEVATTYVESDLEELEYAQSADIMYIVHRDYPVRKLTRSGHASWAIADVSFTDAPATWGNGTDGYPGSVEFYEDRLCFGGNYANPDTVWCSKVGEYTVFTTGANDDDPVTYTLGARHVNSIQWLSADRRLLSGTRGEEWWASGPSDTEPMTPSQAVVAKRDSAWGSERIMPLNIGGVIFYIQNSNRIIREMKYDFTQDKYISQDLIVFSEHLTSNYKILSMAYQQHPYQILWSVREDGVLLGMTYMKEQDVFGWHKHTTDGTFESVATIPGDTETELWAVIKRTIDGSDVKYIERMGNFNYGDKEDAFFVDSGLTYSGDAATTISGLAHLEGETVSVLADGSEVFDKTVSSGSITLDSSASVVQVGLGYDSVVSPLDVVVEDKLGTLQGGIKRVTNVIFYLIESQGGEFGPDSNTLDDIPYYDTDLFTGWTDDLSFDAGFDRETNIYINHSGLLPFEIAAITVELED